MTAGAGTRPKVAVLMAVFRDARFLSAQISSIRAQSHADLDLWVSRDCDEEDVGRVLEEHRRTFRAGRFHLRAGPRRGTAANFLSLAFDEAIRADYFAYADQDDVWEPDKLSRAVAALERVPAGAPALYCSRSSLIDEKGRPLGLAPFHGRRPPCFRNALAQNIASGHGAVFNRAARELLRASGVREAASHDWWTYLLVTGAGGRVFYDPRPNVRYRLHDRNDVGAAMGWRSRTLRRIRNLAGRRFSRVTAANIRALREAGGLLTAENRRILDIYERARERRLPFRLWGLWKSGVHRQTRMESFWLFAAAALNRL